MSEKKLWNRILSCGHTRLTSLPYIAGKYDKPKKGDDCYCRQCCNNSKVIDVEEATSEEMEEMGEWEKYFEEMKGGKK